MSTASRAREDKEAHPEKFCSKRGPVRPLVSWSPECRDCGAPFNDGDMPRSGLCPACEA